MDIPKLFLGIEFGSTRIKAVLINDANHLIAQSSFKWENRLIDGVWTYSVKDIWHGLQSCYLLLKNQVSSEYHFTLKKIEAIGISGMMHGYIALDKNDELLIPFRTWRNTRTHDASVQLTRLFSFAIPQRWSIAHLYQAILDEEPHINNIAYITTLAGYVHYKLTGKRVLGIGDASGMFPIDSTVKGYDKNKIMMFDKLTGGMTRWKLSDILPEVLIAGADAGCLSEKGALLLDPTGDLEPGIKFCPPEGDAATGMVATNAIKPRSGNVSAGTSLFSMIVLERPLSKPYDIIDIVSTPTGEDVAMVHVNNCTSDIDAWVDLIKDALKMFNCEVSSDELYDRLYRSVFIGDSDIGKLLSYNYYSGEHITGFSEGRPILARMPESKLTIPNLMKANLFSAIAVLRIGMDILVNSEHIEINRITGHGGLFKTPIIGQKILASAINLPVATMEFSSEGGPFGMALLANYMMNKSKFNSLDKYLEMVVFQHISSHIELPDQQLRSDFNNYFDRYKKGLSIEKQAIESLE